MEDMPTVPSISTEMPKDEQKNMFRMSVEEFRTVLKAGDVLFIALAMFIAVYLRTTTLNLPVSSAFLVLDVIAFVLFSGIWLFLTSANELNSVKHTTTPQDMMRVLVRVFIQMYIVYGIIYVGALLFIPAELRPSMFLLYVAIASTVLVAGWRAAAVSFVSTIYEPYRIVLWGEGESAERFKRFMEEESTETYTIVHHITETHGDSSDFVDRLVRALNLNNPLELEPYISEIVLVNTGDERSNEEVDALMRAYELGIRIVTMPVFYERLTRRVPVRHIRNDWQIVIPMDRQHTIQLYPILKRVMDFVLAIIVGIIFVPFFPLIALAIRLDSAGDIFYSQERMGFNGRTFRIYKFRTMIQDAEKFSGAVFAQENDPRITRVGRFMRKTRIDELPQLYNVLRGEMSFVGPRPEREYHVDRLAKKIPFYRTRLRVRPGLTGWAQVKYGYGADDDDARVKLEYDLYYIRHASLKFDLVILYKTAFKVLSMSGQ